VQKGTSAYSDIHTPRFAAGAQSKFYEVYDYLFRHGQWVTNDNSLRQSAAKLRLSLDGFNHDFLDRRYRRSNNKPFF
jgi:hypothetical protein